MQESMAYLLLTAGHTLNYPLQYLRNHLGKFSSRVKLQQVGGQKAREATPVSSPSSEQFNIVARAIYETVQPKQVQNRCHSCIHLCITGSADHHRTSSHCWAHLCLTVVNTTVNLNVVLH